MFSRMPSRQIPAVSNRVKEEEPLSGRERAVAVTLGVLVVFMPWAFGARNVWAQWTALGLAAVAVLFALAPMRGERIVRGEGGEGDAPARAGGWRRLVRFPLFWLGLVYLGFVLCQALNPAAVRISTPLWWRLEFVDPVAWLPSGIQAPFERMNAWRILVIHGAAWLAVCAAWTGITERRGLLLVLNMFIAGGALLGLLGILQKVTGAKEIFWSVPSPAGGFHASYVYDNHAGAFLNLVVVAALGVGLWRHARGVKRMEKSTPAPIYVLAAVVAGCSLLTGGSRAAALLLLVFVVTAVGVTVLWRLLVRGEINRTLTVVCTGTALAVVVAAGVFLDARKAIDSALDVLKQQDSRDVLIRVTARQATWEMFEAQPLTGWGAGSFRHVFPLYQKNHPLIHKQGRFTLSWDHAHNDHVQLLAEKGLFGAGCAALALLWVGWRFLRDKIWSNPGHLLFGLGLIVPLAHAWVDFPLSNASILTCFVVLVTLLARWVEINATRDRRVAAIVASGRA
jgi:O-antigen ligase